MLCAVVLVWALVQGLAGGVSAADCAPLTGSLTLKTAQDVTSLKTCTTFTGNIVVAADGPSSIDLTGLTSVSGNIDVENVANLSSLSSTSLTTVSSFTLNNLPVLSNLSFPALSNFSSLKWYNLPALEECVIATGALGGEIQEISILNTGIRKLEWLAWPVGSQLNISNNANLKTFSIPYSSINAGSALTLSNNTQLSTIDLTQVSAIYGGLQVAANAAMKELDFSKLESIGGFVQLSGGFTNISMPALNQINGALRVEATGDITSLCDTLAEKKLNGHYDCTANSQKTAASATTTGAAAATITATNRNSTDGNANGSGSTVITQRQKAGIAVAAILFTFLVIIATFLYFRRRSHRQVQEILALNHNTNTTSNLNLPSTNINPKTLSTDSFQLSGLGSGPGPVFDSSIPNSPMELESPAVALELGEGKRWTRVELPATVPIEMEGQHGFSEVERGPERHELPA